MGILTDISRYVYHHDEDTHKYKLETPIEVTKIVNHYWYGTRYESATIVELRAKKCDSYSCSVGGTDIDLIAIDDKGEHYVVWRDLTSETPLTIERVLKQNKDFELNSLRYWHIN